MSACFDSLQSSEVLFLVAMFITMFVTIAVLWENTA